MKKVGINGFGRIGRAYLRLALEDEAVSVVAVNDLMSVSDAAYLLKYDSVYGRSDADISGDDGLLRIGDTAIPWFSVKNPEELPWRSLDVDVVIESTGVFASYTRSYAHVNAGAKHVVITAPVKDAPPENVKGETVLVGVNTERIAECTVTSNASCTTNAVGIPLSALHRGIGVEKVLLNTVHGYTSTQRTVDSVSVKSDMRYGRAAALNIIPSSTGAASATAKAVPELRGRFDGVALRVPVPAGSVADVTFVAGRETTVSEVNAVLTGCVLRSVRSHGGTAGFFGYHRGTVRVRRRSVHDAGGRWHAGEDSSCGTTMKRAMPAPLLNTRNMREGVRITVGADHAGFTLKELVKAHLSGEGYAVHDVGAAGFDPLDDYPLYMKKAAESVLSSSSVGFLFGGSGQGEAMVVNRFPGIRAAVYAAADPDMLSAVRGHNDANILSFGARFLSEPDVLAAVSLFLSTPFPGDDRHARRIRMIDGEV